MEQEKSVAIRGDKELALYELETRFAMAVRQRELLEKYIRDRLKPDKHFYTIDDEPGRKPSLTKEGAELICLPHNLKCHYELLFGPDNPPLDDSPYQMTIKCEMENNGRFEGEGIGSASSMLTKKDGTRVQRQKDPGLRHNATIKMACKSAYIAATLNATAASEFFTQDLEDDHTGGSNKHEPDKEHLCPIHNVANFKKGKMKWYAHTYTDKDGNKQWCSESEQQGWLKEQAKSKPETEQPPEPEPPVGQEPEESPPEEAEAKISQLFPTDPSTITNIEKLAAALKKDFGLSYQQQWDELNIKSWNGLAIKPSEAYIQIASVRG